MQECGYGINVSFDHSYFCHGNHGFQTVVRDSRLVKGEIEVDKRKKDVAMR